jgi:hypothetical protein
MLFKQLLALFALALGVQAGQSPQDQVPPADLMKIKPSDFADDELDLPYYIVNFHKVANSIPLEGNLRGWIGASVWRGNRNQNTYNARVLESQLSLAYFYCTKRPWNPYYGHPAVRARLEAMLERWCNMQGHNGEFSEYAEGRWGVAPTAFATKFMGESLRLLADGPPIDAKLHERVKQAQRKAIIATLTDPDFWKHGQSYANQFSNIWAGGLAWLAQHPNDQEVRDMLMKRMKEAAAGLQSPAGYFYERDGSDWGYSLSTHHSNLQIAWHYARGTAFEPLILDEVRRYYDWLGWNAVIEPDGSGFVLNRAIETRQRMPWIGIDERPQNRNNSSVPEAEAVESARAFVQNRQERAAQLARQRAELEKKWPNVPDMQEGNMRSYSPYAFLHRNMVRWLPSPGQQAESRANLPYMRDGRYAHFRADNRHNVYYLYVRRPNYYVAFNAGEKLSETQRYGLGLLWAPAEGTLAQSQTGSNDNMWGTKPFGQDLPYEAGDLKAKIEVGAKQIKPQPGAINLGSDDVTVSYALGATGSKTIKYGDDRINIKIEHPGGFFESVPLLVRENDRLSIDKNRVLLRRNGRDILTIEFDPAASAELLEKGGSIGPYQIATARIKSKDRLSYSVLIAPDRSAGTQAAIACTREKYILCATTNLRSVPCLQAVPLDARKHTASDEAAADAILLNKNWK